MGRKPTVSRFLGSIFRSLNDVIEGSLFEILLSITLKPGSTAFGIGVRICYQLFLDAALLMNNQGWTYQRVEFNNCSVCRC